MARKAFLLLFLVYLVLPASEQAFAQRRIREYPSRINGSQGFSYYRYHRRTVSYPVASKPYIRPAYRRTAIPLKYAAYGNPVIYGQNINPMQQQVFEEEIREEYRTFGEPSESPAEFTNSRIYALESEVLDLKNMIEDLSKKIDRSLANIPKRQGVEDKEKIDKLKKELRELRALLGEFGKR